MSGKTERALLAAILVAFIALGSVYSVVAPLFEASDEKWHYPMVKYIADHWSLPVQEPGVETPWRQEGSQPPLYYFLGALATCWIDTSDMDQVRHLNPHVDPGATPDGNVNLVVHNPALERFPWRGTVLAVHLVRLLSVLMGVAAVYLTYLIVREVLPEQPTLALGSAAIHAFTPMVIFISGAVNNDNLVVLLSSLALLMLLRLLPDPSGFPKPEGSWRVPGGRYLALGLVLGLAALTKSSSLALTVLTALVVVVRAVRRRSWAEFLVGGVATLLPLLLVAGWWYLRNLRLYGDLTGFNAFFEVLGTRDVPADLAQLWRERGSFAAGYWGNFGGLNVPMPGWVYTALNTLTVVAALGLAVLLLRQILRARERLFICHLSPLGTRRLRSLVVVGSRHLVLPGPADLSRYLRLVALASAGLEWVVPAPIGHWSLAIGHFPVGPGSHRTLRLDRAGLRAARAPGRHPGRRHPPPVGGQLWRGNAVIGLRPGGVVGRQATAVG